MGRSRCNKPVLSLGRQRNHSICVLQFPLSTSAIRAARSSSSCSSGLFQNWLSANVGVTDISSLAPGLMLPTVFNNSASGRDCCWKEAFYLLPKFSNMAWSCCSYWSFSCWPLAGSSSSACSSDESSPVGSSSFLFQTFSILVTLSLQNLNHSPISLRLATDASSSFSYSSSLDMSSSACWVMSRSSKAI